MKLQYLVFVLRCVQFPAVIMISFFLPTIVKKPSKNIIKDFIKQIKKINFLK